MTQIKKLKNTQGVQVYPQTHTKAVIDDNGYTAEGRLQAMQDEINQAQLEIGAVPSDLTPTSGSTNWVTSGGVYNALEVATEEYVNVDLSSLTEQNCSVGSTMWYMNTSTNAQRHKAIPVVEGEIYSISRQNDKNCQIAWLSSSYNPPYVNNSSLPLATGQTGRIETKGRIVVPENAAYLAFSTVDGSGIVYEIALLKRANKYDALNERMENLESYTEQYITKTEIRELSSISIDYFINTDAKWSSSTIYTSKLFDVSEYKECIIKITKNGNHACRFAFLSQKTVVARQLPSYCSGYSKYIQIDTSDEKTYTIPQDCNYLYVYTNADGIDVTPYIYIDVPLIETITEHSFSKKSDVDISGLTEQNCSLGLASVGWYMDDSTQAQRHIALSVQQGDVYRITASAGGWWGYLTSAYSPPYSNSDTIPYVGGTDRMPRPTNYMVKIPKGCAYLALTTVDGAGNVVTWTVEKGEAIRKLSLPVPVKLRLAHWNVGHFALGANYDTTISPEQYETMQKKWALKINDINADIMMCCEYNTNFVNASNGNAAITARDAIFPSDIYKYAYIGSKPSSSSYMQTAIFSNKALTGVTQVVYPQTTQVGRYYQKGTMVLNGREIIFIETHLDFNQGTTGEGNRAAQIQKLISDFSDNKYVVIAADFNTESSTEYDSFKNAGYKMANHGYLGDFVTYPAGNNPTKVLDNIICKGFTVNNINIINDAELSDHCCIYADFTMIE